MTNEATSTSTTPATDDNVIEGAIVEVTPDNALVVLDPTRYATELFKPYQDELAKAKRTASRVPYNIKTAEGLALAKAYSKTFVQVRTKADKVKTDAKRPIDQAGKKILEIFNALAAAAKVEQEKHDAAIEAREAEIAAEEQRKKDAARARTEALEGKVAAIRLFPSTMASADSERLRAALVEWEAKRLSPEEFAEYTEDALAALNATVDQLRAQLIVVEDREATERQRLKDQEELKRLKDEKAQRDADEAERDRVAKAEAAEAERKAEEQRQLLAKQQAELAKQQAAMLEIQAINQRGLVDGTALELHRALVDAQQLDVSDAAFGGMASMAAMAQQMAINAIGAKYQARLALDVDVDHETAIEEDAYWAARQAERMVPSPAPRRSFGGGGFYAAPRPVAPVIEVPPAVTIIEAAAPEVAEVERPSNAEILDLVADHFCVFPATALVWLRDLVRFAESPQSDLL